MQAQTILITTLPILPENIVATNYDNIQFTSTISGSPLACSWRLQSSDRTTSDNFISGSECISQYSSVCEIKERSVSFNYTSNFPMLNDVSYLISCFASDGNEYFEEIDIAVRGTKFL